MYLVNIITDKHKAPKLSLHGRIESTEEIKHEISELLKTAEDSKSIIIDLSGVLSISEEFIEMLNDLNLKYDIEYVGYSIFIEDQLKKHNII